MPQRFLLLIFLFTFANREIDNVTKFWEFRNKMATENGFGFEVSVMLFFIHGTPGR